MIFQSDEVKLTKKVNFVFYGFIFFKGDTIRLSIFYSKKIQFSDQQKNYFIKISKVKPTCQFG
tara:strand:- start:14465 stop:14653 length:189 start_codon:yes stop_codon:yes gene_type:complete